MIKIRKSITSAILAAALSLSALSGCSSGSSQDTNTLASSAAETTTSEAEPTTSETDTTETPVEASKRITIDGTKFLVDGKEIWMNGANVPWDNWNDFGGNLDGFFWDDEFRTLHENGVNSVRVWITCNGDVGIDIDENGFVSGATDAHWSSLDLLFSLAKKHHIYIMATLISFDHFKDANKNYERWRNMVQSDEAIDSYVDNYLKVFLEKYGDNDYLWSIDLCNEPDWVIENKECGKLPADSMGNYFAKCAAFIHENSDVLVTIGFGMAKYNSTKQTADYGSAKYLQSIYDNENAYTDFYSTHYYDWQASWLGEPFDGTPADFGLTEEKPAVLGEMPAVGIPGTASGSTKRTLTECYEALLANGWNGVMPWTANGVDDCGDWDDVGPAANAILDAHEDLVFPLGDRETEN